MKKILRIITFALSSISAVGTANAFGFMRNSDMYDFVGTPGFGMFVGFGVAAVAIGVLLFLFWLWMLIDCLKRDFKGNYDKIVWVLVMVFLHILGALIYYFVVKVQDNKAGKGKKR